MPTINAIGTPQITLGGTFTMSGAYTFIGQLTGNTNVTFPTSGTLATTGGSVVSIQGTANQVLVNGTSGTPVTGTAITLTTPQDIATTSSPTFVGLTLSSAILGATAMQSGAAENALTFTYTASAVNYYGITNAITGTTPAFRSLGSDTNINMNLFTKGTGIFALTSENLTTPLQILNGTSAQHVTNFAFANTSATRTVTFQDADGTVAFLSNIPTTYVESVVPTSATVPVVTGTPTNLTSISCTAGTWVIEGNLISRPSSTTTTAAIVAGISLLNGQFEGDVNGPDPSYPATTINGVGVPASGTLMVPTGAGIFVFGSTTTVYLVGQVNYSGPSCGIAGRLWAKQLYA